MVCCLGLNVAKQVLDGVNEVLTRLISHIKKDEKMMARKSDQA
jgi:hypothetical protein